MNKKVYRFFFMFLEKQERFLNRMAGNGWRLLKTTRLSYEFAPCPPGEYEYKVVFIGEKSYRDNKGCRAFFEDMGYRVFTKSANLNFSVGKMRWRPYGKGGGKAATSPGSYNKEIMIAEKKRDGKAFEVFNDNSDLAGYYRVIRNVFTSLLALIAALLGYAIFTKTATVPMLIVGFIAAAALLVPIIKYTKQANHYKQEMQIRD